jgi:trimethylamine--corrinoid protein Co-methyltransferase
VLDDIVRACQLANAFEEIDLAVGIDVPVADVEPPELANVMAIRTVLSYCLHHIVCAPTNPTEMWDWITLLQSVIDTGDLIREPVMTVEVAATSPLLLDEGSSGVLSLAVEHGLPVLTMPMPAGGGTAPVTTAGQLVQQNAEVLFLVAAAQMLRPGTPCFYGGIPCTFDLRTGIVSVAGPEFPLLVSATVEMGHLYGLPVFSETKYTDTFALDEQCGAEKVMSAFAAVASGTDVVYANGDLDIVTTLSLEQIIIDLDFVLAVERFLHPVSVDDAPQLLHDAEHRGLGRGDPKDAQMPGPRRSGEPALPQLISEFNNLSAARTQLERAHQIVQEIVSQPAATLVGDDVGARLERAFERRKQQILSGT